VKIGDDFDDLSGFSGLFSSSYEDTTRFITELKDDPSFAKHLRNIEFLEISVKNLQFENEKNHNRIKDLELELDQLYKEAGASINLNKKLLQQVEKYKSLTKNFLNEK
jgi:predicted RNase H-like nuclease (RuvC/YqgF family)